MKIVRILLFRNSDLLVLLDLIALGMASEYSFVNSSLTFAGYMLDYLWPLELFKSTNDCQ